MGERADELRSEDPDEIRADIEETRAEMSETIDAIQERMSPDYLKQQALDTVRDAAVGQYEDARDSVKGASLSMWETIKQNPIPSALVGVGLGWLYMNRSSGSSQQSSQYRYYQPSYGARYGYDPYDTRYGERYDQEGMASSPGTGMGEQVGETMRDAQHRVGDMAGQVGHVAEDVRERAGHAGHMVQHQVQSTGSQLQEMYYRNPLGIGLVAVGAGLIAGLVVPETRREQELMGSKRDELMQQAREKVEDTVERVEHVAERAAEEARHAAEEEAREQGLTE
jgi:hypothetical protein